MVKIVVLEKGWVTFSANFRGGSGVPTNDFWRQKTIVLGLSYGEKNAENFSQLSRAHQRHSRQTDDRQTTDRTSIAYSELELKFTFAKKLKPVVVLYFFCGFILKIVSAVYVEAE